ncbi:DUF460 domain-containing protein [Candidatus Woesearchaeota archaeon]|nr:DUF460 domain-containing protein [Candidatus Woesearchaeota archaeon]
MVRTLLIAGIDPGTTVGYAAMNTKGVVIAAGSGKGIGINELVSEITKEGRVIAVGTDKRKCPLLIEKFAAKTGARIIKPECDISVREKNLIKARNEHERDAIAAAGFAYKELNPLLQKIRAFVKKQEKEERIKDIMEIVVTKKVGITKTIKQLESEK